MVVKLSLNSQLREEKKSKPSLMRREGYVPAILYGPKTKNIKLKIKSLPLEKTYKKSGESTLIDLQVGEEKTIKVIIKDIQKNIINDKIEHVDFFEVDMNKKIEVEIPLEFIGEAPAVKELGGTFMKNLESIQVKCLPGDLIESIEVDTSSLKTYEDDINVRDLGIPDNFEIITQSTAQVANVLAPRIVEEETDIKEEVAAGGEEEAGTEKTDDQAKDENKKESKNEKKK
ncbi:50S ribosomal protein L25 [Candidatus Falkowbacteria bacterium]|nr:MAG: 50S ribosomal protein L25 [Candidatus Falkowbacteria bacterium]